MSTLLAITNGDPAAALIGWAGRFAASREEALVVLWVNREPDRALGHGHESVTLRDSDPAGAILAETERRRAGLLIVNAGDTTLVLDERTPLCEGLLKQATCEVMVIDPGRTDGSRCKRILVPMGMPLSSEAVRSAERLVEEDGRITPLLVGGELGEDARKIAQHELDYELAEAGIQASGSIRATVVLADRYEEGVMQRADEYDLILAGSSTMLRLRQLQPYLHQPRESPIAGAIVRPARSERETPWGGLTGRFKRWWPQLESTDRMDLFSRLQSGSRWTADFALMMALSAALATLGLLQGSTAVVIGAMVVAPLMTPLIGAGLAMVQGNLRLFRHSVRTTLFGLGLGLAVSVGLTEVTPMEELSLEVLMRGQPTLLDLGVAFLSGAAAAYAMARPNVLAALGGVATAAALVPPLASAGIALATGHPIVARGAAILLITNLVAIILGAAGVFRLVGVQGARGGVGPRLWVRRSVLALILVSVLLVAPLGMWTAQMLAAGQIRPMAYPLSPTVGRAILARLSREKGIDLLLAGRSGADWDDTDVTIVLTANRPVPPMLITDLERIVEQVRGYDVNVKVRVVSEAPFASASPRPADGSQTPASRPSE